MNAFSPLFRFAALSGLLALLLVGAVDAAKENVPTPGEYGVYAKTAKGLTRIVTNIVYEEERTHILYLEGNKPIRFPLSTVEYFVIYGKHNMQYFTLNNLKPLRMTPLGVPCFMFGTEVSIDVQKKSDVLFVVKPKGMLGRGYYALWVEDSAWDFMIQ